MKRFWDSLVLPILDQLQPTQVIEVGSFEGENTEALLRFCHAHGASLHAVDPNPRFYVEAWRGIYGDHFQFHQAKSLEVLMNLPPADLVLIDGDHNWYTVYHELKQLAESAKAGGSAYPVVLCHDIGWPYGRRDLYADPSDIPLAFRQPYETKGVWSGSPDMRPPGINHDPWVASHEGGPRNGVLTAIEDFVAECDDPMRLIQVTGFHGLGIVYPESLAERKPALSTYLDQVAGGMEILGRFLSQLDDEITSETAPDLDIRRNVT